MRYFFDNNLPPHFAHAIRELCKSDTRVLEVVHLRDKYVANAIDHEWISDLGKSGRWVVISQDGFRKNDLEREALRKSGLIVFVLSKQWSSHQFWIKAHNLVKWWPDIMDQVERISGGAAYRVGWQHTKRFEQIKI